MQSGNPIKVRFDSTMRVGSVEKDANNQDVLPAELEVVAGSKTERAVFSVPVQHIQNGTYALRLRDMHNTAVGQYSEVALRKQIEHGRNGGRRRGRLRDIENYIKNYLRSQNPHATPADIWRSIPTYEGVDKFGDIFRDSHGRKPAVFQEGGPSRTEPYHIFFDSFRRYVYEIKEELRGLAQ